MGSIQSNVNNSGYYSGPLNNNSDVTQVENADTSTNIKIERCEVLEELLNQDKNKPGNLWETKLKYDGEKFKSEMQVNYKPAAEKPADNYHIEFFIITVVLLVHILILAVLKKNIFTSRKILVLYKILLFPFFIIFLPAIYVLFVKNNSFFGTIDLILIIIIIIYIYYCWNKFSKRN